MVVIIQHNMSIIVKPMYLSKISKWTKGVCDRISPRGGEKKRIRVRISAAVGSIPKTAHGSLWTNSMILKGSGLILLSEMHEKGEECKKKKKKKKKVDNVTVKILM